MVLDNEADTNLQALKSRKRRSVWRLVALRLSAQNKQTNVNQYPSGMAKVMERYIWWLLLSPPLNVFETSDIFPSCTKTPIGFQRLSGHMGETLYLVPLFRALREDTERWSWASWDEQGLDSPSSSSLVSALSMLAPLRWVLSHPAESG